jgi:hypothetical protein
MERRRFVRDLVTAGTAVLAPGSVGFRTTGAALERLNPRIHKKLRAKRLADVSRRVRIESLKVNAEYAVIERDPDACSKKIGAAFE